MPSATSGVVEWRDAACRFAESAAGRKARRRSERGKPQRAAFTFSATSGATQVVHISG